MVQPDATKRLKLVHDRAGYRVHVAAVIITSLGVILCSAIIYSSWAQWNAHLVLALSFSWCFSGVGLFILFVHPTSLQVSEDGFSGRFVYGGRIVPWSSVRFVRKGFGRASFKPGRMILWVLVRTRNRALLFDVCVFRIEGRGQSESWDLNSGAYRTPLDPYLEAAGIIDRQQAP